MTIPSAKKARFKRGMAQSLKLVPRLTVDVRRALSPGDLAPFTTAARAGHINRELLTLADDLASALTTDALEHRWTRAAGIGSELLTDDMLDAVPIWIAERVRDSAATWAQAQLDAWRLVLDWAYRERVAQDDAAIVLRLVTGLSPLQARQAIRAADELATADEARAISMLYRRVPGLKSALDKLTDAARRVRALMISESEVAEAFNQGILEAARHGAILEATWYTQRDERVCPVCGPLHLRRRPIGAAFDDDGRLIKPPAHPRCRCVVIPD